MTILYNFASRNRPAKFFAALDNIKKLSTSNDYIILAKIDDNDTSDYSRLKDYPEVVKVGGLSKSKIHAINRGMFQNGFDIVVNMSDDMVFIRDGFDEIIRMHCGADDFVHFPDGNVNEKLCTMSIMGIGYYKRFGYVYHPDYSSLWCDNEAQEVAKKLGRYKFVNQQIFEHRHPAFGKAERDAQYRYTESFYNKDMIVYNRRKAKGFPI
jgi:hypothetical protein